MLDVASPVILKGNLVRLESFSDKYITQEYAGWLRDEEMSSIVNKARMDIRLDEVRSYCEGLMKSKDNHFFAIVMNENERHIGNVRVGPCLLQARHCQFGMMIGDKDYHNKGIGTEVVGLVKNFCFEVLKLHKIFLDVREDNNAAIRIYEKNGFIVEGTLRDHLYKNNRYYNLVVMGVINVDD